MPRAKQDGGEDTERDKKKKRRAELVKKAIQAFEDKLGGNEIKATVGDFVRLLQLEREIDADEPREVKITWVAQDETGSSTKK